MTDEGNPYDEVYLLLSDCKVQGGPSRSTRRSAAHPRLAAGVAALFAGSILLVPAGLALRDGVATLAAVLLAVAAAAAIAAYRNAVRKVHRFCACSGSMGRGASGLIVACPNGSCEGRRRWRQRVDGHGQR